MSRARQAAALLAVGVLAALVGFGATAWLDGARSGPPAAVAAPAPAAPPEEALLSPPPASASPPAPAQPAPVPEAPPPPPPQPEPEPDARTAPPPAPDPEPPPEPEAPAPAKPRPAPEPSPPPPAVLAPPDPPPSGVVIPATELPSGQEPPRRALAEALAAAAPGSTEAADIRRGLALWAAYLGPDAVSVPEGRRQTIARALRANAWWFARRGSPRERVILRDPDGILLTYRAGQGFAVNPVASAGRWRGLNDDVPAEGLAEALLGMGAERRAGEREFLAWEYHDVADDLGAIRPGASAMAQARVALVMAHAHARTGDPRFARGARDALAAFTVEVDRGGVRSMVAIDPSQAPAPWYVERAYPGESPWKGAALNGFMVTLLNLRGAAAALGGEPGAAALARDLADRGAATLARHLEDHDSGSWSYYGLMTPGRPWRTYLADLNYHCYHVRLLDQLAGAYPSMAFASVAARWRGYVDRAGASCPARPG